MPLLTELESIFGLDSINMAVLRTLGHWKGACVGEMFRAGFSTLAADGDVRAPNAKDVDNLFFVIKSARRGVRASSRRLLPKLGWADVVVIMWRPFLTGCGV